ncbi:MAG: hypothetical protein IKR86_03660 [Candidatus Methanomethylophilaceae archaeon]|nr:hypothetical protein [Candidatus Methanomethylophilaceae archaeon]
MGLIAKSIISRTGPGLALQEMMYGFIMALLFISAARFEILNISTAMDIIVLMVGMDFTWGAIDCILFYTIDVLEQRRMLNYMRSDLSTDVKAELMSNDFDCTPLDLVSPDQRLEACKRIALLDMESEEQLKEDRRRMAGSAFYCFIATVLPLVPTVLPLLLIEDIDDALFVASSLSAITMFFVGWRMGNHIGMKGWQLGLIITSLAWAITLIATFTGG